MERRELAPRVVSQYLQNKSMLAMIDPACIVLTSADIQEPVWWITITFYKNAIGPLVKRLCKDWRTMPNPMLSLYLKHALFNDTQLLAGIRGIRDFALITRTIIVSDDANDGRLIEQERNCYLTMGSNVQAVCALKEVDVELTTSNDIHQIFAEFGIDAAQQAIEDNLLDAMQSSNASVAMQHIKLIAATMCFCGYPAALTYSGMTSRDTASWFKRATFERCLDSFLGAGIAAHKDNLRGISEAIVAGTKVSLGTGGDFSLVPRNDMVPPPSLITPMKNKSLVFTIPDISHFLNHNKNDRFLNKHNTNNNNNMEDNITFDFSNYNDDVVIQELLLPLNIPHKSSVNTIRTTQHPVENTVTKKRKLYFFAPRECSNVLRPSSPLPIAATISNYGPTLLLVPTSPKQRKPTTKRKGVSQRKTLDDYASTTIPTHQQLLLVEKENQQKLQYQPPPSPKKKKPRKQNTPRQPKKQKQLSAITTPKKNVAHNNITSFFQTLGNSLQKNNSTITSLLPAVLRPTSPTITTEL